MDELVGEFISETSESLAALERTLGDPMRQTMTTESWSMAARLMHTIKGTCGFLRFGTMEAAAARAEQLLEQLRDQEAPHAASDIASLRTAMAQISFMMDYLARHGHEPATLPPMPEMVAPASEEVPAAPHALLDQVGERLHRASEQAGAALAAPATALVVTAESSERVSARTLGTLVQLRNRLQHRFGKADADVGALTSLLASLKQRVLPHAPGQYFPRLEEVVIVQAGAMRFAIAQSLVREIVRIHEQQRPASLEDGAMMSLHGSWMPRLSLAQRLGKGQPAQEAYALVVQAETGPMALCVEQVEGLAQLMLQPVPRLLRAVPIYRAAAILGDGSPCLLLDTDALLQRRPPAATEAAPAPHAAAPAVRKTPYLLFDDGAPKAMALTQVARVEPVAVSELFAQGGHYEYVRGGRVFRLALLPGAVLPHGGEAQALFLLHAPDCALLAHRVGGIVDAALPPHASHGDFDGITAELVDGSAYFMPEALHG